MQKQNLFLCAVNLVYIMQPIQALEWQAYKEIKTVVENCTAAKEKFENDFENLEYTAINVEKYNGRSYNVFLFCAEALRMNASDDVVTVIQVWKKDFTGRGCQSNLYDIIKCLQDYISDSSRQRFHTEGICLDVRTMRGKDLIGYEMVNENYTRKVDMYNYIQREFIKFLDEKIKMYISECLNKYAHKLIVEHIAEENIKVRDIDQGDFRLKFADSEMLKSKIVDGIKKKGYRALYSDYERESIIKNLRSQFFEGEMKVIVSELVNVHIDFEKIRLDIEYDKKCIYKNESILLMRNKRKEYFSEQIYDFYANGFRDIMLNGIETGFLQIEKHLAEGNITFRLDYFIGIASWLKSELSKLESENFESIRKEKNKLYRSFIRNSPFYWILIGGKTAFNFVTDFNFSSNLLELKNCCITTSTKIVIHEQITEDNIYVLHHILDKIMTSTPVMYPEIIFISLKHGFDLFWDMDIDQNLILNSRAENFWFKPLGFRLFISKVLTKKKGRLDLHESSVTCDIPQHMHTPTARNNTYKIQNHVSSKKPIRQIDITFDFEKILAEKSELNSQHISFSDHAIIVVKIKSAFLTVNFEIKTYRDDRSIELTRIYDANINPDHISHENEQIAYGKRLQTILEFRHLANLMTYIKNSYIFEHLNEFHILSFELMDTHSFNGMVFPVSSASACELDAAVYRRMDEMQKVIVEYYKTKDDSKIVNTEIFISDYLTRRIHTYNWKQVTEKFCNDSSLDVTLLEEEIHKFLTDQNEFDATNESEVAGTKINEYKIVLCAVVRNNRNTLLYLIRRQLKLGLSYKPLSSILECHQTLLKTLSSSKKTHPLDAIHKTIQTPAHPASYIFRVLLDPETNLLDILHVDACFEVDMKPYKKLSTLIAQSIHKDISEQKYIGRVYQTSRNMKTCYITGLEKLLEREVYNVIQFIKLQRERMNSKTEIKLAGTSFGSFDSSDGIELNELNLQFSESEQ